MKGRIMNRYVLIVLSAALALGASNVALGSTISSNFDSGDEGWGGVSFSLPLNTNPPIQTGSSFVTYNPIGGNPGGFISSIDPDPDLLYFSAPAKFLGDQSAAFGNTLSFDAKDIGGVNDDPELILTGGGMTLYYLAGLDPSTAWTHFEITLAPDTTWHLNYLGNLATISDKDFSSVLSSLDGMYLLGDWASGPDDSGLDNVELIPEPSTGLLFGLGLVGLGLRKKFIM
jgi:hypothetical protein